MFRVRCAVGLLTLVLALPSAILAQVTSADIVGRVTDPSGAVLPGATITVENAATQETRVAPSNATGDYVFNLLPIGTYTIKIELAGFGSQTSRVTLTGRSCTAFSEMSALHSNAFSDVPELQLEVGAHAVPCRHQRVARQPEQSAD